MLAILTPCKLCLLLLHSFKHRISPLDPPALAPTTTHCSVPLCGDSGRLEPGTAIFMIHQSFFLLQHYQ